MRKVYPLLLALLLVGLTCRTSRSQEEDYRCQADKLSVHLACTEAGSDSSSYPRLDFEFMVVICSDRQEGPYDIKVIQKDPTLVFKGSVKEATGTRLLMEFNAAGGYHFQVQVEKKGRVIVYPPKLALPAEGLLVEKTADGELRFKAGDEAVPNTVYVRGYQPVRQCWGFAEPESVPVEAE